MTATYTVPTPVYLRIGTRPQYHMGTIHADTHGRIDPEELVAFLAAVSDHIQALCDKERRAWRDRVLGHKSGAAEEGMT